jgi:endonuclease YncB( thermonuclease family)
MRAHRTCCIITLLGLGALGCDRSGGDAPGEREVVKLGQTDTTAPAAPDDSAGGPRRETDTYLMAPWPKGVVDGDTLRLRKLSGKLRLLHVDTEEKFTGDERARASRDWKEYLEEETRDPGFDKFGTPMGERSRQFAKKFFKKRPRVELEYQHEHRQRGYLGRHLAYIWVRDGQDWTNYNIELVRQGLSPYFTKYGYSTLYHDEFVAAQDEARAANRGIWGDDARSYPDYEERLELWNRRAEQIEYFRENFGERADAIELEHDSALDLLAERVGETTIVFGELAPVGEEAPKDAVGMLFFRRDNDLPVVGEGLSADDLPDPDDVAYVYARGTPRLRDDRVVLVLGDARNLRDAEKPPKPRK